jgi:hypothetical protein
MPIHYISAKTRRALQADKERDYLRSGSLSCQRVDGAVITLCSQNATDLRSPIFDLFGRRVEYGATKRGRVGEEIPDCDAISKIDLDYKNAPKNDLKSVFIGSIHGHYGHIITEGIARLWYLIDSKEYDQCVYVAETGFDAKSETRFLELCELFGLDTGKIERIYETTVFRTLYVPEPSIRFYDYYHKEYVRTIDKIIEGAKKQKGDNSRQNSFLYVNKLKSLNARNINEIELSDVMEKNKVRQIVPEDINMGTFINLLQQFDTLIAISGTASHNAVFKRKGSRMICLNRSHHIHPLQTMICESRDIELVYVDCFAISTDLQFGHLPCFVYKTKYFKNWLSTLELVNPPNQYSQRTLHFIKFFYITLRVLIRDYLNLR